MINVHINNTVPATTALNTSGEKGFTLIEVMVAIIILSVGLLGMASLTTGIIRGNKLSNDQSIATTLAQDKMEDVKDLGYKGMPSTDTTTTQGYNSITGFGAYKRVTQTVVDSPAAGMKTITITTYWDSDAHFVEVKTILQD